MGLGRAKHLDLESRTNTMDQNRTWPLDNKFCGMVGVVIPQHTHRPNFLGRRPAEQKKTTNNENEQNKKDKRNDEYFCVGLVSTFVLRMLRCCSQP